MSQKAQPTEALPAALAARLVPEQERVIDLRGVRVRLFDELVAPTPGDDLRVFRAGIGISGLGTDEEIENNRLLHVGQGAAAEVVSRLARALELAHPEEVAGVLPQMVDHWHLPEGEVLLTSDHIDQARWLTNPNQWRTLPLELACEMLIGLTVALGWLHDQQLSLGGVRWDQLMLDTERKRLALGRVTTLRSLVTLEPTARLAAIQRDIAAVGRLLVEVATGRPFEEIGRDLARVLDDAQRLVNLGLHRPGLAQLSIGALIHEAPFGYTQTQDLLHGLLQLRAELAPSLTFTCAMASTAGNFPLRRTDQDSCGRSEVTVAYHGIERHLGFYCVADGVGGEEHGERASQAAVFAAMGAFHRALAAYPFELIHQNASAVCRSTVKVAAQHLAILGEADHDNNKGATTFSAALIAGDRLGLGHVGDSRIYLLRGDTLTLLTRDHNLSNVKAALQEMTGVEEPNGQEDERRISRYLSTGSEAPMSWVDAFDPRLIDTLLERQPLDLPGLDEPRRKPGDLSPGLRVDPGGARYANGITDFPHDVHDERPDRELEALDAWLTLLPGDQIILMSDGLYGELLDEDMGRFIREMADPQQAVHALLKAAMADLSMDNITVVLIRVGQRPGF